ncbi:hypothetical protein AB3N58_01925 [Leptospira sp. WS60.C2]
MQIRKYFYLIIALIFFNCAFNNTTILDFQATENENGICTVKYRNGEIFIGSCIKESGHFKPVFGKMTSLNKNEFYVNFTETGKVAMSVRIDDIESFPYNFTFVSDNVNGLQSLKCLHGNCVNGNGKAEISYEGYRGVYNGSFDEMFPSSGEVKDLENSKLIQYIVNNSEFTKTKNFESFLTKRQQEREKANQVYAREQALKIEKEKKFCNNLVDRVPKNAVPRNSSDGEYFRACSNLWVTGSSDFYTCVQWWRDCQKYW